MAIRLNISFPWRSATTFGALQFLTDRLRVAAKFLVDKNGNVVKRWVSVTEPPEMIPFIEAAIAGTPMPGGGH